MAGEAMNSGKLNKHLLAVIYILVALCATRFTYLHIPDMRVSMYQAQNTDDWSPPFM
jgi:hypothetical protein